MHVHMYIHIETDVVISSCLHLEEVDPSEADRTIATGVEGKRGHCKSDHHPQQ